MARRTFEINLFGQLEVTPTDWPHSGDKMACQLGNYRGNNGRNPSGSEMDMTSCILGFLQTIHKRVELYQMMIWACMSGNGIVYSEYSLICVVTGKSIISPDTKSV